MLVQSDVACSDDAAVQMRACKQERDASITRSATEHHHDGPTQPQQRNDSMRQSRVHYDTTVCGPMRAGTSTQADAVPNPTTNTPVSPKPLTSAHGAAGESRLRSIARECSGAWRHHVAGNAGIADIHKRAATRVSRRNFRFTP